MVVWATSDFSESWAAILDPNATMSAINSPPPRPPARTCFALVGLRKGGDAIINQGVGVEPGSAARNTYSRTSRRESIKIGTFPAGQYHYCHTLLIADGPCLDLFGLRTC